MKNNKSRLWKIALLGGFAAAVPCVGIKATAQDKPPTKAEPPAAKAEQPPAKSEQLPTPKPAPPIVPLASPDVLSDQKPLPINLATALSLANAQAWDIAIAGERIRVASALLQQSNVLWLPTIVAGVDYQHHDGRIQNADASLTDKSRSSIEFGGAPEAVFSFSEAIFEPLAARRVVQAREADFQTATNDTTFDVAQAYFNVLQARGDLAGNIDTTKRTREMVRRIESMAPDLVPTVEIARARAQLSRFEQTERSARERWEVASAELARIIRLDPLALLVPIEPPHLQITLISPDEKFESLLSIAVTRRPELAAFQSLTDAAQHRVREEQFRPLLPVIYARGNGNQLPDSMAFGAFGGGSGSQLNNFGVRSDWEVQAMWELRNLGLGNLASVRRRQAEYSVAQMEGLRARISWRVRQLRLMPAFAQPARGPFMPRPNSRKRLYRPIKTMRV